MPNCRVRDLSRPPRKDSIQYDERYLDADAKIRVPTVYQLITSVYQKHWPTAQYDEHYLDADAKIRAPTVF